MNTKQNNEIHENFAKQIQIIRKNNKLSMSEFAESLGVAKSRVNMWENNGVIPRPELLVHISKEYKTSLHILLGIEEISSYNEKQNSLFQFLLTLDNSQLEKADKILKIVFSDN
ncbi:helix-turn-helix domain-containing protein [Lactococcus garvieae]|uniref:helix-turn-helix domain-containing protein n=1 Tax=Lactococcus TaxID=1357 RepID=UPI0022E5213B|nr:MULTISPECIES: helix-turn-helix transcriptional regulator [Lactococcus]MDN5629491.1 helix-turn-helix domain-containing protein [Lactococcus sp.]